MTGEIPALNPTLVGKLRALGDRHAAGRQVIGATAVEGPKLAPDQLADLRNFAARENTNPDYSAKITDPSGFNPEDNN